MRPASIQYSAGLPLNEKAVAMMAIAQTSDHTMGAVPSFLESGFIANILPGPGAAPFRSIAAAFDSLSPFYNPRSIRQALQGSKLGEFWKYQVGDYRIICKIEDDRLLILVLRVGHRRILPLTLHRGWG
jgi:hypothetical protein